MLPTQWEIDMKALCWHGKKDVRFDTVDDPIIGHPRDAIIKVSACAICGSDLHLFDGFMLGMESGDIMGHEFMGEVVEVGHDNTALKVGERVVVPFTIFCGDCEQCKRGNLSVCERSNRNKEAADKVFGHATAGLFGYSHLTGGYAGGQAEYVRVPFADCTHVKVPDGLTDEQQPRRHAMDRAPVCRQVVRRMRCGAARAARRTTVQGGLLRTRLRRVRAWRATSAEFEAPGFPPARVHPEAVPP
jgi:hypothetical protein